MNNIPLQLIIATFKDTAEASKALNTLKAAKKDESLTYINAATIQRDDEGKIHFKETADVQAGKGSVFGAVVGGLIGLLAGPGGAVLGAAVGAATGGFSAKALDMGIPNGRLQEMGECLKNNSSALIVMAEMAATEKVVSTLKALDAEILTESIRADIQSQWNNPVD